MEDLYPLISLYKIYVKAVRCSHMVRNVRYKIKISGVYPQPGNQTSADHSLSSTGGLDGR